jgi:hypothetical protein
MRILRDGMAFTNLFAMMTNSFVRDQGSARNDNAAKSGASRNRVAFYRCGQNRRHARTELRASGCTHAMRAALGMAISG